MDTRHSAETLTGEFAPLIDALLFCEAMIVGEISSPDEQGECNAKTAYSHRGLMGHLHSKREGVHIINGCQWHRIVRHYLNELYPTWNDTDHGDHKRRRDEGGPPGENDEGTSSTIKRR